MKAVLVSSYKEEYLLNWWLPHHAKKFDYGIIADFNPDREDNSTYELVKKFGLHNWKVIKIVDKEVSNAQWDVILTSLEAQFLKEHPGSSIICLNPTEFLIGDTSILDNMPKNSKILVANHIMFDSPENDWIEPDPNVPLLKQRTHGIHYSKFFPHPYDCPAKTEYLNRIQGVELDKGNNVNCVFRWMRSFHNYPLNYLNESLFGVGRHFWNLEEFTDKLMICHMYLSPYTENFITRKLQIQEKLTQEDFQTKRGIHHIITRDAITQIKSIYNDLITDLKDDINKLEKFDE